MGREIVPEDIVGEIVHYVEVLARNMTRDHGRDPVACGVALATLGAVNGVLRHMREGGLAVKTVVFDFDGVVSNYRGGWVAADVIEDGPVLEVVDAIKQLRKMDWRVVIYSSRCHQTGGEEAIREWLARYKIEVDDVVSYKPPARVYVDDRAVLFDGKGSTDDLVEKICSFRSWIEDRVVVEEEKP